MWPEEYEDYGIFTPHRYVRVWAPGLEDPKVGAFVRGMNEGAGARKKSGGHRPQRRKKHDDRKKRKFVLSFFKKKRSPAVKRWWAVRWTGGGVRLRGQGTRVSRGDDLAFGLGKFV